MLKAPSLRDLGVQRRFTTLFNEHGIAPERLVYRGPSGLADMMQEYGELDIALDPTPYNGGTTTLQALWMGVPVVSMEGGNFVSRMGASFLRTLKRPEWIATDDAQFVAIALGLAATIDQSRRDRAAYRMAMQNSPLCDISAYVNDIEQLYRRMWVEYCHRTGGDIADRVLCLTANNTPLHHQD